METIKVKTTSKQYDVLTGAGILQDAGELVSRVVSPCKALIVTDDVVEPLYAATVVESLQTAGFDCDVFAVKNGEKSKNEKNYWSIVKRLAQRPFHRNDVVVALGGGVVGDLAGFAASTYMRGIRLVQMPTTLLAGIDSSVGGKTAINLAEGKNLVGTFYQPDLVLFDTDTLQTLDEDNFANGMGEGVKYAVLAGGDLFEMLENGLDRARGMTAFCSACIKTKRDIVEQDEKETGLRKLLNLGHTWAHAAERVSGYNLSHGRAVAAGLIEAAYVSNKMGLLQNGASDRISKMLDNNGLRAATTFSKAKIMDYLTVDKKVDGGDIDFVAIEDIGKCVIQKMPLADFTKYLK